MNISFGAFRLINSYGAFGSVTKVRHEVVLEGTREVFLTKQTKWREFEFFCKPGDIDRYGELLSYFYTAYTCMFLTSFWFSFSIYQFISLFYTLGFIIFIPLHSRRVIY